MFTKNYWNKHDLTTALPSVKQKVLIPWNKNDPEEFKDGNELVVADRGGFIFEPKVGIHDDVGELDFASLYPKIMLSHNLSGETENASVVQIQQIWLLSLDSTSAKNGSA